MEETGNDRGRCSQRFCCGKKPEICWLNFPSKHDIAALRQTCAHADLQLWMHARSQKGEGSIDLKVMVAGVCALGI